MRAMQLPPSFAQPLRTPRLELRSLCLHDAAALVDAITESLPALRAWPDALPWAMQAPSRAAFEAFVRSSVADAQRGTALVYGVWEQGTQSLLGSVGMHALDWQARQGEIGFWCRSSRTGNGVAHEAAAALLHCALSEWGLLRVEALTDAGNVRSRALLERLGMQRVRTLHHEATEPPAGPRSTCVYAACAA